MTVEDVLEKIQLLVFQGKTNPSELLCALFATCADQMLDASPSPHVSLSLHNQASATSIRPAQQSLRETVRELINFDAVFSHAENTNTQPRRFSTYKILQHQQAAMVKMKKKKR